MGSSIVTSFEEKNPPHKKPGKEQYTASKSTGFGFQFFIYCVAMGTIWKRFDLNIVDDAGTLPGLFALLWQSVFGVAWGLSFSYLLHFTGLLLVFVLKIFQSPVFVQEFEIVS